MTRFLVCLATATLLAVPGVASSAVAGETIEQIKTRRTLRCGVSDSMLGFSTQDATGRWSGLDVDICRAVAAAALGDPERVTFVPLRASARFPALRLGTIELLARNTTWTLTREAGLKIVFAGISFYDAQAFMVQASSKVTAVAQLKGATVCVQRGTTSEDNLADYFAAQGWDVTPLVMGSMVEAAEAFFAGRCEAYTADATHLAATGLQPPQGRRVRILPERISREPHAPAVRSGDDDWLILVRWVLFALIAAEEAGITQAKAQAGMSDATVRRALEVDADIGKALGTGPDWALRAVQSVGNYGEMFERNLGSASPLKLERGLNRLWNRGGLMYAPPLR